MQQHPIPQNILDIEFKLFGRFTVKEFAYLALGVGFGGIFLFFFTKGMLPGIIAIPVFLFSSAVGIALAVVPINDQKADVFIRNYISAITKPTLRVWKNALFDEKVEWEAEQRGLKLTSKGDKNAMPSTTTRPEIVGGGAEIARNQFIEESKLQEIEEEEESRLKKIEELAKEASALEAEQPLVANIPQAESESGQSQTTATVTSQENPNNQLQPTAQQSTLMPVQNLPDGYQSQMLTDKPNQAATIAESTKRAPTPSSDMITIGPGISNQGVAIEGFQPAPNSINLVIQGRNAEPVPQATVIIRRSDGGIVQVNQSNSQGYVLPNKPYNPGEYIVEIRQDKYNFPKLRMLLENQPQQPVLVKPLT